MSHRNLSALLGDDYAQRVRALRKTEGGCMPSSALAELVMVGGQWKMDCKAVEAIALK